MPHQTIQLAWALLVATSTTEVFVPGTDWFTAQEMKKIAITLEIVGLIGNIQLKRAYQTADTPSSADAATGLGSFVTANGMSYPSTSTDVSSTMEGKQLVRFGYIVSLTSGTTVATASVAGKVDVIPA